MSNSYRALLQSLDEADEIARGLGRQVKFAGKSSKRRSCCARCCSSAACVWTWIVLGLALGLAISVVIPVMIAFPSLGSQWQLRQWFQNWTITVSSSPSSNDSGSLASGPGSAKDGNWTLVPEGSPLPEADGSGDVNGTSSLTAFFREIDARWKLMVEWMKQRYDETPKVPLIVGVAIPIFGFIIIIGVIIRRKIKRRQRRRALGKLVTDLQSGKTLLSTSDDSEDE